MIQDEQPNFAPPLTGDPIVKLHLPCYLTGFLLDIEKMNAMYRMPVLETLGDEWGRIEQFQSILREECNEIDDIRTEYSNANMVLEGASRERARVMMADLLGDIIVYCASEAKRWNIPIDRVLHIIMQSNFSKLDSNGQPIYDERMKLMKGQNYWKPEPKIAELLKESHA